MFSNGLEVRKKYDIIVVGGGPAGYVSAIRSAQLGAKVALVEKNQLGGTCLNRGCIPTKYYLKNAQFIQSLSSWKNRGIQVNQDITIQMSQMVADKNKVVDTLKNGIKGLLQSNKIDLFQGEAMIYEDKIVRVGEEELAGEAIILATGSKPFSLGIKGEDLPAVLTSDEILDIQSVPKSLVIVGAGVIGLEIATIFHSFGTQVTLVESKEHAIDFMDQELVVAMEKQLKKWGVELLTSEKVNAIEPMGDKVKVILSNSERIADNVLLTVGRKGDTQSIQHLNLAMNRGFVQVSENMQTSIPWLYAPGDVNGRKMLAHAASRMGEIAAERAVNGTCDSIAWNSIPCGIYSNPEIGSIGMTQAEAEDDRGVDHIAIGRFYFGGNGRALASGEAQGFIKIVADSEYGEILGAYIFGENGTEMINEIAVIMNNELTLEEVVRSIHAHPTYSEVIVEACADALGRSIHLPNKR